MLNIGEVLYGPPPGVIYPNMTHEACLHPNSIRCKALSMHKTSVRDAKIYATVLCIGYIVGLITIFVKYCRDHNIYYTPKFYFHMPNAKPPKHGKKRKSIDEEAEIEVVAINLKDIKKDLLEDHKRRSSLKQSKVALMKDDRRLRKTKRKKCTTVHFEEVKEDVDKEQDENFHHLTEKTIERRTSISVPPKTHCNNKTEEKTENLPLVELTCEDNIQVTVSIIGLPKLQKEVEI